MNTPYTIENENRTGKVVGIFGFLFGFLSGVLGRLSRGLFSGRAVDISFNPIPQLVPFAILFGVTTVICGVVAAKKKHLRLGIVDVILGVIVLMLLALDWYWG